MPGYSCSLNILPVELLHTLFTYFLAHELLLTFADVSDYINVILLSYSAYQLNFEFIRRSQFDLIRRCISSKQVISLTLSDGYHAFGHSESFFSQFHIEQFTQLRSLKLIQIEFTALNLIFSNLHQLKQLRSLSFDVDTIRQKYPAWNSDYANEQNRLTSFLFRTYTRVLPQLNRLCLNNSSELVSIPLPYLRRLKLSKCSLDDLGIILLNAPQLKALDICLNIDFWNPEFRLPVNRLIELKLKIQKYHVSRDEIEQFLSRLTHLKYFEVDLCVLKDVADGRFWKIWANSLITFHFKFHELYVPIQRTLDSFRTPFWLEEKHWYVAFYNDCLFSIPHFAPLQIDSLDLSQLHAITAPDHSLMYTNLKTCVINAIPSIVNKHLRLSQIKTLVLERSISLTMLKSIINLRYIHHLVVPSLESLLAFVPLEDVFPQMNYLTIKNSVTIDTIEQVRGYQFEQVRTLQIRLANDYVDCVIEELFRLFPGTENFTCKSPVESTHLLIRLINGFKFLTNASFCADCLFLGKNSHFCRHPNSILPRLQSDCVPCRVYHSFNTNLPFSIQWKIEKQSSIDVSMFQWPWRRGYYYYRSMYVLLGILYDNMLWLTYVMHFVIYFLIITVILRHHYSFNANFLGLCVGNTTLIIIFQHLFYRLSMTVRDDNAYIAYACRIYIWFAYSVTVFLILFSNQMMYVHLLR